MTPSEILICDSPSMNYAALKSGCLVSRSEVQPRDLHDVAKRKPLAMLNKSFNNNVINIISFMAVIKNSSTFSLWLYPLHNYFQAGR